VERRVPPLSRAELLNALRQGLREAYRDGIVRVHSAGGDGESGTIRRTAPPEPVDRPFYSALFAAVPEFTPALFEKAEQLRRTHHDEWLSGGAIKFPPMVSFESHTAAILEPYSDDPSSAAS
jgi:predicted amidohydrolase YtcJ